MAETQRVWQSQLQRLQTQPLPSSRTPSATQQRLLHSAHYRTLLSPTVYTEPQLGGSGLDYVGMDDKVHSTDGGAHHYSDLSLWDTHRSQMPWLTLTQPKVRTRACMCVHAQPR